MRRLAPLLIALALASPAAAEVARLQARMAAGRLSSAELVRRYQQRIRRLNPTLHAVIALNPDALRQARALDRERRLKGPRGPLHGVPVLIKDNIETADPVATTAGSLALKSNLTGRDAFVVARLRAQGAVVLGKANLSEWANFRSDHSISGWSATGGLARNPHVLDRSPCGSSSGSAVAVAADLAPVAVGTETDGSIVCPASMNGVVGLKPTLGLVSRIHVVPIAHSQDTAGPMGRSVADVAALLAGMAGSDPADPATAGADAHRTDYAAGLRPDALRGKRLGVVRALVKRRPELGPAFERALQALRAAGAELVELEAPSRTQIGEDELVVLKSEFKADLNAYLASLPPGAKVRTLDELIAFNASSKAELALFGQDLFEDSARAPGLDDPAYRTALERAKRLAGAEGIDRLLTENRLDALVSPTAGPPWRLDIVAGDQFTGGFSTLAAVAGYPHLTVPMGHLRGLPLGISFVGTAWSDAELLAMGYAFEQRSKAFRAPSLRKGLVGE